jgi:hypothetical protein
MLGRFTKHMKILLLRVCFIRKMAPTRAVVIVLPSDHFPTSCPTLEHVSVALTETLIPAPVTDMLIDM